MIEPIINSFNIKYTILDREIEEKIKSGNHINIYISIESICKYFYSDAFVEYVDRGKLEKIYNSLAPLLVNMGAHYRHYFHTRWKVTSTIIFYDTDYNSSNNITYCPEYNLSNLTMINKEQNLKISSFIKTNLENFNSISKYLKDFSYIKLNKTEGGLIPYHIIKNSSDLQTNHLIITKNPLDLQLINLQNTFILFVNKDKSTILTKENIFEESLKKDNVIYRPKMHLSSELLPMILSHSGVKTRSIQGLKGTRFTTIMKRIEKKISQGQLINGKIVDHKIFNDILGINEEAYKTVINNYRAISYDYQYNFLDNYQKDLIKTSMDTYIQNNHDLLELNQKIFRGFEIKQHYLEEGIK